MPRTSVMSANASSAPSAPGTSPGPDPTHVSARDPAHQLAARAVAHLIGRPADDVVLRSLCRHCGGAHGALSVIAPVDTGVTVSLSRAPGVVVAAASLLGPIGIDIESVARMTRAPVDAVALHPLELDALAQLEPAVRDLARTVQWTRKEALLKATGFGLRIPPASIALSGLGDVVFDQSNEAVQVVDAPDLLWNDLDDGGFTPVFEDLRGVGARHPQSTASVSNDLVGSLCVLSSSSRE
jgi:4'-phosphopantetheinyl transferase